MVRVKMGFYGLTVPDQVERTRLITGKMTGNVNYSTPNPTLAAINDAADELETAFNASRNRDKEKMAAMRLRRKELLALVVLLAGYVQTTSGGDEEKILSSGFDIRTKGLPKPDTAGDVVGLQLRDGAVSGNLLVLWEPAPYAIMYVIEVATNAEFTDSKFKAITTRTQKEITGLTAGSTVWVRVRGLGRENLGNPSSPVSILVR